MAGSVFPFEHSRLGVGLQACEVCARAARFSGPLQTDAESSVEPLHAEMERREDCGKIERGLAAAWRRNKVFTAGRRVARPGRLDLITSVPR